MFRPEISNDSPESAASLFRYNNSIIVYSVKLKCLSQVYCHSNELVYSSQYTCLPFHLKSVLVHYLPSLHLTCRCTMCRRLLTFSLAQCTACVPKRTLVGADGALVHLHLPDVAFDVNEHVLGVNCEL